MKNQRMIALRGDRTQKEMAKLIGIPTSTYAMIESGHRFPRRALQRRLAQFFQVTVDELFFSQAEGEEDGPELEAEAEQEGLCANASDELK